MEMQRTAWRRLHFTIHARTRCCTAWSSALTARKSSVDARRLSSEATPPPIKPNLDDVSTTTFPGSSLKVWKIGFGSPWIGASYSRTAELDRALSSKRCNIIQIAAKDDRHFVPTKDSRGQVVKEWEHGSWEGMAMNNVSQELPRDQLILVWNLPADGLSVKDALDPARVNAELDKMLKYHFLDYVDALILEIPRVSKFQVPDKEIGEHRESVRHNVRRVLTEIRPRVGKAVRAIGFSWVDNPHEPYPGCQSECPAADIISIRDQVASGLPLVLMFPVSLGGASVKIPEGGFALPNVDGVFQIGTGVLQSRRKDGRPFRWIDVEPPPVDKVLAAVNRNFAGAIRMEELFREMFGDKGEGNADASETDKDTASAQDTAAQTSPSAGEQGGEESRAKEAEGPSFSKPRVTVSERPPSKEKIGPLPPLEDITWGQTLYDRRNGLARLDEWTCVLEHEIWPTLGNSVKMLKEAGKSPREWGFAYRRQITMLLNCLTDLRKDGKKYQLEIALDAVEALCPSLTLPSNEAARSLQDDEGLQGPDIDHSVKGKLSNQDDTSTKIARLALSTGVDCVLSEDIIGLSEQINPRHYDQVPLEEVRSVYEKFNLEEVLQDSE